MRSRVLMGCLNLTSGIWATFVITNGHRIDMCFDGDGLCAQILDIFTSSIVEEKMWEGPFYVICLKRRRGILRFGPSVIFASQLRFQKFEMTICAFHDCKSDGTIPCCEFLQFKVLFVG